MNKVYWCLLLLATALVCAESNREFSAEGQAGGRKLAETSDETAVEHQRILAELEEVHQLRERMLQEGEQYLLVCIFTFQCTPAGRPSTSTGHHRPPQMASALSASP